MIQRRDLEAAVVIVGDDAFAVGEAVVEAERTGAVGEGRQILAFIGSPGNPALDEMLAELVVAPEESGGS
jgi:hypothetical protein